jgi:tetratricopeptide (TPR) repeat protein
LISNDEHTTMRRCIVVLITLIPAIALANDGPTSQPASQPAGEPGGGAASRPTTDTGAKTAPRAEAPADEATRAAKRFFEQGEVQYRLGNFDKALEEFQAALSLVRRPTILINIAQCYRQLKQLEKARFYFKLFLSDWERHKPGTVSPYHAEVKKRIAELTEAIESQQQQRPSPLRWPKWTGVGLSGALLITATILEILTQNKRNDLDEGKGRITVAEAVDLQEDAHQLRMWSNTAWAVTGTVAVATAILFIFDRSTSGSQESSKRYARLQVLRGGMGLSVHF